MEAKIYNQKGEDAGKISLPEKVFGLSWNADLVHQVVTSQMSNKRSNNAHTKDRSEVRGGGKKPWKQKGTGQARHGSIRSPIWVGGGVTHGPRNERNITKKINKKMGIKALFSVLSKKYKDGEVFFIDSIKIPEIKTKKAAEIVLALSKIKGLEKIKKAYKPKANIAFYGKDEKAFKSFKNIPSVYLSDIKHLNTLDAINFKNLIIVDPEKSVEFLVKKMSK